MRGIGITMLLSIVVISQAGADVDIQYELSTGHVSAARNTPPPIESAEGSGLVTLTGVSTADIMWPVPSGCAAGRPEWSRVTNPDTVAANGTGLALRSGLLFFSTTSTILPGCHLVSSWNELQRLARNAVITYLRSNSNYEFFETMNDVNVLVFRRCPGVTGGANCDTARANMNAIDTLLPSAAVLASATTQLVTLGTNMVNFRDAQVALGTPGW